MTSNLRITPVGRKPRPTPPLHLVPRREHHLLEHLEDTDLDGGMLGLPPGGRALDDLCPCGGPLVVYPINTSPFVETRCRLCRTKLWPEPLPWPEPYWEPLVLDAYGCWWKSGEMPAPRAVPVRIIVKTSGRRTSSRLPDEVAS